MIFFFFWTNMTNSCFFPPIQDLSFLKAVDTSCLECKGGGVTQSNSHIRSMALMHTSCFAKTSLYRAPK